MIELIALPFECLVAFVFLFVNYTRMGKAMRAVAQDEEAAWLAGINVQKVYLVVTGLGMLTPVGNSVEDSWQAVQAGQSGISNIEHFDTEKFAVKFAGLVKDFNCDIAIKERI